MDKELSHSLSTIVLPEGAASSEAGTYMRLEGFSVTLFNEESMQQLITLFFNLQNETPVILDLLAKQLDILHVLGTELKVFYNTASDYWRIHIDMDKLTAEYANSEEFKQKDQNDLQKRKRLQVD